MQFKYIKTEQEQKKRWKGHQILSTRPASQCVRFKIIEVFSSRISWFCLFWCLCLVLKKALLRNSYILSAQTLKIKNAWNWRNEPEVKRAVLADNPGFIPAPTQQLIAAWWLQGILHPLWSLQASEHMHTLSHTNTYIMGFEKTKLLEVKIKWSLVSEVDLYLRSLYWINIFKQSFLPFSI